MIDVGKIYLKQTLDDKSKLSLKDKMILDDFIKENKGLLEKLSKK
jgi:hypothetical protein